jgi:peptidoglycan/xylan/chitin deacetylase (PgdA/CDA1 family)
VPRRLILAIALVSASHAVSAAGRQLVEPRLALAATVSSAPRIALTLDACGGMADKRIIDTLIAQGIPATIFVTARWIRRNRAVFAALTRHPELFEIENHGAQHRAAVERVAAIFGVAAAGSRAAVEDEILHGAAAIVAAGAPAPTWYRGATAEYTTASIAIARRLGFRVAGFSLNADGGARLGARETERRLLRARDGDVVIAHVNQPARAAGSGVVRAILALQARGYRFVRLRDTVTIGSDGTTGPTSLAPDAETRPPAPH